MNFQENGCHLVMTYSYTITDPTINDRWNNNTSLLESLVNWDVSQVTNMDDIFNFDPNGGFTRQLNNQSTNSIANWDVSQVTSFKNTFKNMTDFNEDIKDWNIVNGVDFSGMFSGCTQFNKNISRWNMRSTVNADLTNMFENSGLSSENEGIEIPATPVANEWLTYNWPMGGAEGSFQLINGVMTAELILDNNSSNDDDFYNNMKIVITSGSGEGETRTITDYDGSRAITVDSNFNVATDNTSNYTIYAGTKITSVTPLDNNYTDLTGNTTYYGYEDGTMTAELTLASDANGNNNDYVGQIIKLTGGAGEGESSTISTYDSSTVITVNPPFTATTDNTTTYQISNIIRTGKMQGELTLANDASSSANYYVGMVVMIDTGNGDDSSGDSHDDGSSGGQTVMTSWMNSGGGNLEIYLDNLQDGGWTIRLVSVSGDGTGFPMTANIDSSTTGSYLFTGVDASIVIAELYDQVIVWYKLLTHNQKT